MFSYWMWTRICSVTGCELEYVQLLDVNVVGLLENEKGRSWRIEEREGRGRCLVANRQLEVPLSQFLYFCLYVKLTEGPGDAIKKNWKIYLKKKIRFFKPITPPGLHWVPQKNFSSIGPAVWPAIRNIHIYTNVLFFIQVFVITHSTWP